MKAWYIIVKIFFVPYASIGPYDSQQECTQALDAYSVEYQGRYDRGERLVFLGKTVNPGHVKAKCEFK